jgi:deoxyxylulose-5-phosphate synthase
VLAHKIAERLDASLVNMRFVKPLDEDLRDRPGRSASRYREH